MRCSLIQWKNPINLYIHIQQSESENYTYIIIYQKTISYSDDAAFDTQRIEGTIKEINELANH